MDGTHRGTPGGFNGQDVQNFVAECAPPTTSNPYGDHKSREGLLVSCYENHGQDSRITETGDLAPTINKQAGTGGNNLPLVTAVQVQWASVGGQIENDSAQALRAGAEHNYQFIRNGLSVRRLTPTECERLQGFPDGWTTQESDSARYRMLGNAVAVPVIRWIAKRIGESIK